jgi:uncharacterized protein (TIGR03083 family)
MPDTQTTWKLIHEERETLVATLEGLTAEEWETPSLCGAWTVRQTAAHILSGAEQTGPHFMAGMLANGMRFNTMMDRGARRLGTLPTTEIVERLRARTTTTNHPPAPIMAMLGEVVTHGEDIRRPLGLDAPSSGDAVVACLEMYKTATFPVGGKKRIAGLHLSATDVDWSCGDGPKVSGPGRALILAMTGRPAGIDGLEGDGLAALRSRFSG